MSHDIARLLDAAVFASIRHRDQRRKDVYESPYINHPIAVANVLATEGQVTDVQLLIAALLHDTVEDTGTSAHEVTDGFGAQISSVVAEVTDDKSLRKAERKQRQVEGAPHKSAQAKQLKIADKICNVRDIDVDSPAGWDLDRKQQYLDWADAVVAGCKGVNEHLDRCFDQAVAQSRKRLRS